MNKEEFILSLRNALSGLGEEEVQKSVDFYTEMIEDAVENGEDEQEFINRLGSVDEISRKIINETPLSKVVKEKVKKRELTTSAIILIIVLSPIWFPLGVAVLSVIAAVYAALWSLVAGLFAVFASFALAGLALLVRSPFLIASVPIKAMLSFGVALFMIGMAVFLFYLSVWCAKWLINLTVFTVNKVKNLIVKGGSDNEKK